MQTASVEKTFKGLSLDSEFRDLDNDPNNDQSLPDESNEDHGQADIGLDEIASLAYEFHFTLCEKRRFPIDEKDHSWHFASELFRPPATLV